MLQVSYWWVREEFNRMLKCFYLLSYRPRLLLNPFPFVDFYAVPWRYVHPQTNYATFRLTQNVHKIFVYCDNYCCKTSTLWHFLLWHSDRKWTDCSPTPKNGWFVTVRHLDPLKFWPTHGCDILSHSDFYFCCVFRLKETLAWDFWLLKGL